MALAQNITFIPGTLTDATLWEPAIKILGTRFCCKVADITSYESVDEMAKAIALDAPSIVIGLSLGSWVALRMAELFPDQCMALVLVSSAPGSLKQASRAIFQTYLDDVKAGKLHAVIEKDLDLDLARQELRPVLTKMMQKHSPEVAMRELEAILHFTGFEQVSHIKCPTLFLRGASDTTVNQARQQQMCQEMPHAKLEIIPNACHYIPLENPTAMCDRILAFLDG